jgi:hypothetical protein
MRRHPGPPRGEAAPDTVAAMPLRNRVTPLGELVADPARGLVYGNRGCLHDGQEHIRRSFATRRWIACRLNFRGWQRGPLMQPGRFTELFFLDEATALAAGHRPCALCRRADYEQLLELWGRLHPGRGGADAVDEQLHRERLTGAGPDRRLHAMAFAGLPDGIFVLDRDTPEAVERGELVEWSPGGYVARRPLPAGEAAVITPPSLVELLRLPREPLVPLFHPSAARAAARH